MHFLRSSNLIIVVGGRRLQDLTFNNDHDAEFIRDTHILDMRTLEWKIVVFQGAQLGGIYNFSSCLTDDGDLYIFGGTKDPMHHNKKLFRISDLKTCQSSPSAMQSHSI
mmetsp:Transcript_37236/g.48991  ORF Transcript_37236/g.48991 Transcript_37236/m.48991 type:complete len:109 (+) Transcript_37236:2353-2679(+)